MALRTTPAAHVALAALAALALGACKDRPLPAPDPRGDNLVPGAIVAAVTTSEPTPGVRTYRVVRVMELPPPMGRRLDLTAYDPKAPTFEDAARAWKAGGMQVVMQHVEVQLPIFLTRDHRVLTVEPAAAADGGAPPGKAAAGDGGR